MSKENFPSQDSVVQTTSEIKQAQLALKTTYQQNPDLALGQLRARVIVKPQNLSCEVVEPAGLNPVGMHRMGGGDGSWVCPVELMLAGLAGCAGVTLGAVADSMKIELRSAAITAVGDLDFCGTLAVNRQAPVGLTKITLRFELETDAPSESVQKLIQLTERYCVVYRTLQQAPELVTETHVRTS
ncbi:MAG: OsmC family protein [Planctomycetaceae bacterium]|nr:OsmC family protein [Planctomycetaceae bacterium]